MPPKPGLPRFNLPPNPIGPLREIIKGGRQQVEKTKDGLHSIVQELHGPTTIKPQKEIETTPTSVAEGTACTLCSSEHFTQVSGDLAEGLRFARQEGLNHPEVVKRVEHARQELNAMERYDLSAAQIQLLSGKERELAEWALTKSRNLRHTINQMITTRSVSDLEKAAAQAETTANEFTKRLWGLAPEAKEECEECAALQGLRGYLERKGKRQGEESGEGVKP